MMPLLPPIFGPDEAGGDAEGLGVEADFGVSCMLGEQALHNEEHGSHDAEDHWDPLGDEGLGDLLPLSGRVDDDGDALSSSAVTGDANTEPTDDDENHAAEMVAG
eukprot:CAMPEP_0168615808 /NCGR_PEP_ID=MMETSP0449_2-20121227/4696_1 /TAXON_ID=1082188 /ORGANISM="Strombidium rassoulzadegani, Strain ras09" /LENGTH=104 /DNA_ID=CAMNT_0008656561 /DNA_START=325 /DNA_END=640 /DNA_ORIENTATION=-